MKQALESQDVPRNDIIHQSLLNAIERERERERERTHEIFPQACSVKIDVLKNFANFTGKHLYLLKETPAQVLSWEHWETCKYTYSEVHLQTIASVFLNSNYK